MIIGRQAEDARNQVKSPHPWLHGFCGEGKCVRNDFFLVLPPVAGRGKVLLIKEKPRREARLQVQRCSHGNGFNTQLTKDRHQAGTVSWLNCPK
jgi:hypothetical protein